MNRLPSWLRQEFPGAGVFKNSRRLSSLKVNTVCQEARCPNMGSCFASACAAYLIMGKECTRSCRFCAVEKNSFRGGEVDWDEPCRVAAAVKESGLKYVVVTSVARDDLIDGGAEVFALALELIRGNNPEIKVELLIPDFQGSDASLRRVAGCGADVIGHNIETVERLNRELRPQSSYRVSLAVLRKLKQFNPELVTKSSLMLGLGERKDEVLESMGDLRDCCCDILTLGQYLAPSGGHYPVKAFITPEKFTEYGDLARGMGFKSVLSGPLVRSSYKAAELAVIVRRHEVPPKQSKNWIASAPSVPRNDEGDICAT